MILETLEENRRLKAEVQKLKDEVSVLRAEIAAMSVAHRQELERRESERNAQAKT